MKTIRGICCYLHYYFLLLSHSSNDNLEVIKMKRNIKNMLMGVALIATTLSVSSCSTRESAINDLQNFSYELRDNSQYYTVKKWKKAVNKFGKIRRRIARHD